MQKIFPETLPTQLTRGLSPFYLLTGADVLLINEAKDQIIQTARNADFDEKQEITIGSDTNWETLFDTVQSIGLFFNRQIVILNFPDSPTTAQLKKIEELCAFSHPDLLFILNVPKFSKATEKQAWFRQIEPTLVQVNCQTPDIAKLPQWVNNRAKTMGLHLESEAVQLLCYRYEGNLLALKQALQLFQLQFNNGTISLKQAKEVVEQAAQFSPFQWIDSLLEGKIVRAVRILHHLKNEEVQAVVLLRIVQKEVQILLEITRPPQPIHSSQPLYNGNLRAEFDRLKIWQNKRLGYQNAVGRLTYRKLYRLIEKLASLEKKVKHTFSDDIWQELEQFCTLFA